MLVEHSPARSPPLVLDEDDLGPGRFSETESPKKPTRAPSFA
jgi:hypothetical protein